MGWGSIQNRLLVHPRGPWLPTLSTSVVTFKSYSAAHSKAMCRKSDTSIIFNLFHKASSHQTAAGDVFFLQKMFRVALLINFCACSIEACSPPPKPMKGKGNVLKQQLFEAYLPNLLQRRFKQRRQVKRVQQVKKKVGPKTNSEKNSEVWWTGGSERTKILNPSHTEYF